jgi:hypothetical protein
MCSSTPSAKVFSTVVSPEELLLDLVVGDELPRV